MTLREMNMERETGLEHPRTDMRTEYGFIPRQ